MGAGVPGTVCGVRERERESASVYVVINVYARVMQWSNSVRRSMGWSAGAIIVR